jgi:predicted anti-sigma-YlaC factor YlaD
LRLDCEYMRQSISAEVDAELSELDQHRLAQHLKRCQACAQFAVALANLTDALRRSPRGARPSDAALGRLQASRAQQQNKPLPPHTAEFLQRPMPAV